MEGRIEWHLLPLLTFYCKLLYLSSFGANICGQNSALERSNLRGGGDISHSKLRAMRGSVSRAFCVLCFESLIVAATL